MQTECLALTAAGARLDVRVRCLHPLARDVAELAQPRDLLFEGGQPSFRTVESLKVDGLVYQTWQEVVEREVCVTDLTLGELLTTPRTVPFSFPACHEREVLHGESGEIVGAVLRGQQAVEGTIAITAVKVGESLVRLRVTITNQTPLADAATCDRDAALLKSLISTHTTSSPSATASSSRCSSRPRNWQPRPASATTSGPGPCWSAKRGSATRSCRRPSSFTTTRRSRRKAPGDRCADGTEIDEILLLRIMTLSDDEKIEGRSLDARTRQILERAETISQHQLMNLHGAIRDRQPVNEVAP